MAGARLRAHRHLPAPARSPAGADRHRRAARGRLRAAERAARRPASRTTPAARATARPRSICCTRAKDVTLVALFSPEHGIRGTLDENVPSSTDTRRRACRSIRSTAPRDGRPARCSQGIDTIVVDLQDVGARFYTYPTTMAYVMEEAAKRQHSGRRARPAEPDRRLADRRADARQAAVGFTGYLPPMPIRHGLTIGELARLFNGEAKIGCDLDVVRWRTGARERVVRRNEPGVGQPVAEHAEPGRGDALPGHRDARVRRTCRSGRGTDTPFEQIGAPWIDGRALASLLNARSIPGVRVYPGALHAGARATFAGEVCQGIFFVVTDREALRPVRLGARGRRGSRSPVRRPLRPREDSVVAGVERAGRSRCVRGGDPAALAARVGSATKPAGGCCGRSICSTDGRHGATRRQGPSQISRTSRVRRSARTCARPSIRSRDSACTSQARRRPSSSNFPS